MSKSAWHGARMLAPITTGIAALLASPASTVAASAAPNTFCSELNRTIEAVELGDVSALEDPAIRSPSFGFSYCSAQGPGWFCHQALAPPPLSIENLTADLLQCHPDMAPLPGNNSGYAQFERGSLRFRIEETGAPGAHVGRIVTFAVEPRP